MLAPDSSTHSSWSIKLSSFIIVNDLKAIHEILRGDDRLNNCYLLFIS